MPGYPMTYAIASGGSITLDRILDYFGGRAGHHLSLGLLPAGLLPLLGAALFGVAVIVSAGWALIRGQRVRTSLPSVVVLVAFWALPSLLLPTHPYLLGFSHRVFSAITADQLRLAATKATALLSTDDSFLPGPGKWSLYNPDKHAALWSEVSALPGVTKLDSSVVMTSRGGVVEMTWGGALAGHWGLRFHSPFVTRDSGDYAYWATEPDIALFMTSD